jgi:hypothetical protein
MNNALATEKKDRSISLWGGLLTVPVVALVNIVVAYTFVQFSCRDADDTRLHLELGIALLLVAAGTFASWRSWRGSDRERSLEDGGMVPRTRFMALCGMMLGLLTLLLIAAQWIPVFILSPCQH